MLNHQQQDYRRYFYYCNTQAPSCAGKLTGDLELAYLKLQVMFWSVRLKSLQFVCRYLWIYS